VHEKMFIRNFSMIKINISSKGLSPYLFGFLFLLTVLFGNRNLFAANGVNIDSSNGLALHGYDSVAYFTEGKALEGKPEFVAEYEGNKWAFVSQDNKNMFLENPAEYMPQYGGYCSYAASRNAIANTDPFAWTIHNKKLYFNYSIGTQRIWLADKNENIILADGYWPELLKQVP